jgi:hypothetical protein
MHGHILKRRGRGITEEVIRPRGLPHHGLRTPTLCNTRRSLLARQQSGLFTGVYLVRLSPVCRRFFNSIWGHTTECEDCNPYDHSRNRSPASVCFLEKQQHEKHVVGVWTDIVGKKPATQYSGAGATNCECDLGAVGFAFAVQTSPRSMSIDARFICGIL